jgi:multidrug efflux pump subunit AcrA (membrane-fusion protein)
VQLGYTTIRSPIDGQTGSLAVKVGGLVTANQTELMTIARVQPVYVTFTVPAIHLATIKRHKAEGALPSPRCRRTATRRAPPARSPSSTTPST